jgi:3-dehydroquinate synthase
VVSLIQNLGFEISHGLLKISRDDSPLLQGMEEFREHLGGELTITLLNAIGEGAEVHEIDTELLKQASIELYNRQFELQQTQI